MQKGIGMQRIEIDAVDVHIGRISGSLMKIVFIDVPFLVVQKLDAAWASHVLHHVIAASAGI